MGNDEQTQIDRLIGNAKILSALSDRCTFIFDIQKNEYLYVSKGSEFWNGIRAEDFKGKGYDFALNIISKDERMKVLEVGRSIDELIQSIPPHEQKGCLFSYEMTIMKGKKGKLVNHQFLPYVMSEKGNLHIIVGTFGLSAMKMPGHFYMKRSDDTFYEYSFDRHS